MIKNKIDQQALTLGRMALSQSVLPNSVKLVADGVLGDLQKPKKKKSPTQPPPMSKCVLKMYHAIASPWSPESTGACIPFFPARPSQKVTAFQRFDIIAGTGGTAFVTVSPTIANDVPFAIYSTSATLYAGNGSPNAVTFTAATGAISAAGVSSVTMTNLPYASTDLLSSTIGTEPNVQGRIVSCSMSIAYTGTTLNQSGLVYCFSDPTHSPASSYSVANILARTETDITGVSRDKCWVQSYPITRAECEYSREAENSYATATNIAQSSTQLARQDSIAVLYPFSGGQEYNTSGANITIGTGTGLPGGATMVAVIQGAVAGATYHVQVVTHAEYIGISTEGKTTMSGFDSVGTEKLLASFGKIPALKQAYPDEPVTNLIARGMKLLDA